MLARLHRPTELQRRKLLRALAREQRIQWTWVQKVRRRPSWARMGLALKRGDRPEGTSRSLHQSTSCVIIWPKHGLHQSTSCMIIWPKHGDNKLQHFVYAITSRHTIPKPPLISHAVHRICDYRCDMHRAAELGRFVRLECM